MYLDNQLICRLTEAINRIACAAPCPSNEGIASCLEVTVEGNWGDVGDRIQEVKWYDLSGANPVVTSVTYFNRNKQRFVSGITADNVIPCVDDLPAVVSVNNFPDVYPIAEETSSSTTTTQVPSSNTVVNLKVANSARKGIAVYNDSTAKLRLKHGAGASSTSFTVILEAGDYYEVPFHYTGLITGIWDSVNGNAYVTEFI